MKSSVVQKNNIAVVVTVQLAVMCNWQYSSARKAPEGEKQLYFGFLLNPLDPPLVSLDMFEEFFLASFEAGKSSSKFLDLGPIPPFLGKCPKLSLN